MKILAVILLLGIMLSSCGNMADSERLNDSAFTTPVESSEVACDSMEVDESSQVGDESDIQSDSSEDDMKWRLFEDTYKETDSGRAAENYAHNKGIKIDGFVKYGQENPPVCDLILGKNRFAGVGCEVIAAYNYLTYEGFEPDMAKLAYDFEKNALIAADGSLGSNPRKISGLFKAMGVGYKRFYKVDEAQAAVEEGKPVIVSYHIGLNIFSGIHTVFAVKEEGRLYVYNCYNSAADKTEVESIYQLMNKNSLFIVGYTEDDGQMR